MVKNKSSNGQKHKAGLIKMLEDRDNALKACLESRDKNWFNSLAHCKESFRLMTYDQVNNHPRGTCFIYLVYLVGSN